MLIEFQPVSCALIKLADKEFWDENIPKNTFLGMSSPPDTKLILIFSSVYNEK